MHQSVGSVLKIAYKIQYMLSNKFNLLSFVVTWNSLDIKYTLNLSTLNFFFNIIIY